MLTNNFSRALTIVAILVTLTGCGGGGSGSNALPGTISVVSSRADMVSGGPALVRIALPAGVDASVVRVTSETSDVTASFRRIGGSMLGLVTGLRLGENRLTATAVAGDFAGRTLAALVLKNHDINGPIISGPHQTPWVCQTESFKLPDGSMLGVARDVNCNAATRVMYVYKRTSTPGFVPFTPGSSMPADMSTTTTLDGRTVNFIVRVETGTINRAIYQFAVLFDPSSDPAPEPLAAYKGWNRRLVFTFGGSAHAGYVQGTRLGQFTDTLGHPLGPEEDKLGRGFAVISSTLNVFGNNANDVLSAETASMVKEKFIKTFGEPIYTMGWGGSGGAMQQHLIANNYPGILDGITPAVSFPDLHSSVLQNAADCALLNKAMTSGVQSWTDAEKTAVSGFNTWATCLQWMGLNYSPAWLQAKATNVPLVDNGGGFVLDLNNCSLSVPRSMTYDAVTNRNGTRCDLFTGIRNLVGIDSSTGFAARTFDNVGVQYGLRAYRAGLISPEQFVELNELAGGYDGDGNLQAVRTVASASGLVAVSELGRLNSGKNLASIPIIDYRVNPGTNANVHDSVRSLITRARLVRANGHAGNQVILRSAPPAAASTALTVLLKMDQWLMSIDSDLNTYSSPLARVAANKPADLSDACFPAAGQRIAETADINNSGECGLQMPFYSNPRMTAGAPLTDDILKCQVTPLLRSSYVDLSDSQYARLAAVFPTGVCDYALPGAGTRALKGSWLTYVGPGSAVPLQ